MKGHQSSAQEAGRWTPGLLEALELKGLVLQEEMKGEIPGVPARDQGESWPPLYSPLIPAAGPCPPPRAPTRNPGSHIQLSWPQQRQPHVCWLEVAQKAPPEEPPLLLKLPQPPLAAALTPTMKPLPHCPPPSPAAAPTIVRTVTVTTAKRHTARPACGLSSIGFPHLTNE